MGLPFIHSATVFNRYIDRSGDATTLKWRRVFLPSVYLQRQRSQVESGGAIGLVWVNTIIIPYSPNYKPPTDEEGVGYYYKPEENDDYFTLNADDVVVSGDVADEVPDKSGSNWLVERYPDRAWVVKIAEDKSFTKYRIGNDVPSGLSVAHYKGADNG